MLNSQAEETARLDLSHQKEKARREELEAENMKLSEAVDSLKAEKTEGFDLNDKVSEV